ncbi:unnamed protein product [Chrysoparadoxa australica]
MGEGQAVVALRALGTATTTGTWVLLQNCHLGLDFIETMEGYLTKMSETCHPDFRLFMTSESHPKFPIGLLQMATKVTNEPPKGLRAGLMRSYTVMVDQDKLERIETSQWRALLYSMFFLHSTVQERRKFGPLGWCIPYEFNDGDLNASIMFLEKHLYSGTISWPTVQYMVGEVHYGGKITDDLDRRMFKTYAEAWLSPAALSASFCFNPETTLQHIAGDFRYIIPEKQEVEEYLKFTQGFPSVDSPEVFGLHPNADLTFRNKEGHQLLHTLLETLPKLAQGGTGQTRDEIVSTKVTELLKAMPEPYIEDRVLEILEKQGGLGIPLNIFVYQETQRLQVVLGLVGDMLVALLQAVRGEVVVTADIMATINAIFDARVPQSWIFSAAGDEISWQSTSLGLWFSGLHGRNEQLSAWLREGRPNAYWLSGFFNAQGFLTAVQQEVTRAHKVDKWALDGVVLHLEVTEFESPKAVKQPPKEGAYIYGLYLDGAAWSKQESSLVESRPKELYTQLPVLYITSVSKQQKKGMGGNAGPFGPYAAPCYKYKQRTDKYAIFMVDLPSREKPPQHWTLRGVALLCQLD